MAFDLPEKNASVDVDRIAQEVDVDAIQNNILNVTYCDIQHELGYHGLDANFIKLFRLAQLTVEYLLHCQEYLQQCLEEKDNKIILDNNQVQQIFVEKKKVEDELMKRNESYKSLKKELQKYKKLIGDYQLMVRAGASGLHKCTCCSKSFVSEYYLRSHLERRHPEEARRLQSLQVPYQTVNQSFKDVEFQNELNEIRSRLKMTEDELTRERENTSILRVKESERNQELLHMFKSEHETWQLEEQERMKSEMQAYKDMMMRELKQSQHEKVILQKNLLELQQTTGKRKSNLGDLLDSDTDQRYIDLNGKIEKMGKDFEAKISEINAKHAKDKIIQNKLHEKELQKERSRSTKTERERIEEKQSYEDHIKQLQQKLEEHAKLLESKIGSDTVDAKPFYSSTSLLPPEPPPRESTSSPVPLERHLPEKDSVCLWVSVNQSFRQSHRVFRTPASTKGDWKDSFSFHALLEPIGEFQMPMYVYSCGGSPYWRQYVSDSNQPPHSSYKHDFTFYVTSTKLLGTMKLFVLNAGSASVVRSTITKQDTLEDWKYKGLCFYAMKSGHTKASLTKSATINSDIFESISDEDVSVSSFTGTDVIKQDLAEDLKRSRENLVEAGDNVTAYEEKEEENSFTDEEEEDELEVVDGKNDEAEQNFAGTSSGSLLMSTLPEKGEFYPFPQNLLAVAQYHHNMDMIMAQRKEIAEILEDNLEKRGVDPDESQMPTAVYKTKMKNHSKEGQLTEKKYSGFGKRRRQIMEALDSFAEETYTRKKRVKNNSKSAVGVVKSAVKFQGKENRRPLPAMDVIDGRQSRSPVNREKAKIQINKVNNGRRADDQDDQDDDDDDEFDISESSEWDSDYEGNKEPPPKVPSVAISQHSPDVSYEDDEQYYQEEVYRPKMRAPQGEKVKNLAASLEASLSLRDPNKKKLAGAVDLYQVEDEHKKQKRSVSFQNANDGDDDGSDFSTTSFDASKNQVNRPPSRSKMLSDDEDDIENLLASYGPSIQRKPAAASTPHSSGPSSRTAVTDFHLDDFDDDSF